ncbi:MAG: hypothetical protein JSS90_09645 [Bacteroidetes bacterium]|jgi:3-phosphoshikimate 1-carboxyvinyltransferase|nr:hypothetical protein [Bacteroidota bacterium]
MAIRIYTYSNITEGEVTVPVSKSENSRIAFIYSLNDSHHPVIETESSDTFQLKKLISSNEHTLDAADGGTTARFIMAWCVIKNREAVITGSERMKQRPISDSVDLLRQIGANITYLDKEGFLPVHIQPATLKKVTVVIADGSRTSQHISAMMMIAPLLGHELNIRLNEKVVSFPYLQLTAAIMQSFGADVKLSTHEITVGNKSYHAHSVQAGGDWSAASYFYEIAALSSSSELVINGLLTESVQGDKIVAEYFRPFGVNTETADGKVILRKKIKSKPEYYTNYFSQCPDIALSLAATCGGLNCKTDLYELQGLLIKECDRVAAFQREGYKLNIKTDFCGGSKLKILEESTIKHTSRILKSYNDHRVIMCFAPLSLVTGEVFLDETESVKKSFPDYFSQLLKLGIKTENV